MIEIFPPFGDVMFGASPDWTCQVVRSSFFFKRTEIWVSQIDHGFFHVSKKTWDCTIQNLVSFKCFFLHLHRNQSRDQPDKSQGHGSLATKIVIWLFRARSPIIFRINQIPGSQNNPNLALISKGSLFLAGSPKQRRNKKGFPSVYTIWINLINV